tara:strand:+ start:324 stop:2210 length:1887 start_codon:yes stop_codon:yes gene_type:complete
MQSSYRKEIDFLRAVAVIYVIAFHFFPNFIPKGYLGVDLFFVISGFLISNQIYNSLKKNNFSLKLFYLKRIRRIIPATLFLVIITSVISFFLYTKNDLALFSESSLFSITFLSNFYFWSIGGYFSATDELKTLLHLWSLGVEEQFYIFFPILFLLVFKLTRNINNLIIIVLLVSLLSLFLNFFLKNNGFSNTAFFLLPTRIWNLSFGVLAMLIFTKYNNYHNNYFASIYLFIIIISILFDIPGVPSDFILIIFTTLFLSSKIPKNFFFKKLIENNFLNYIGLISFSLYLWHWPILVFFKYYNVYEVSFITKIIGLMIVIVFSIISYKYVEQIFRYKLSLKSFFTYLFMMLVSIIIFSSYNILNNKKYDENYYEIISKNSFTNFKCKFKNIINYKGSKACLVNKLPNNSKNKVALLGNSHMQMYVPSIKPFLEKKSLEAILISSTGCLPTININIADTCLQRAKENFNKYSEDDYIKTIIIGTTWISNQLYDGKNYIEDDILLFAKSLIHLVKKLEEKNKKVYLIGPIQTPSFDFPQDLSRLIKFKHIKKDEIESKLKINKNIFDKNFSESIILLKKELNDNFIDVSEIICDDKFCFLGDEKGSFFADDGHLSQYGASLVSKKFEIVFK